MVVNESKLPDSFVALIDRPQPLDYWIPKEDVDASGHEYRSDLILLDRLAKIEEETNSLPVSFHVSSMMPEDFEEWTRRYGQRPGFIPYITDFSKIVSFGRTPSGETYCFDCRDDPDEPSIIYWDDGYWVRRAPNFDTFISWFEPLET
jgi:SMI1/KNR4 family protein SUKH-1